MATKKAILEALDPFLIPDLANVAFSFVDADDYLEDRHLFTLAHVLKNLMNTEAREFDACMYVEPDWFEYEISSILRVTFRLPFCKVFIPVTRKLQLQHSVSRIDDHRIVEVLERFKTLRDSALFRDLCWEHV